VVLIGGSCLSDQSRIFFFLNLKGSAFLNYENWVSSAKTKTCAVYTQYGTFHGAVGAKTAAHFVFCDTLCVCLSVPLNLWAMHWNQQAYFRNGYLQAFKALKLIIF